MHTPVDPQKRRRPIKTDDLVRVLRDDGTVDASRDPNLDAQTLSRIFEAMMRARVLDERLSLLARDRTTHVHIPAAGLEASVVGTAAALRDEDWIFPGVRDVGAFLYRNVSVERIVGDAFGVEGGTACGRQMPAHHTARAQRLASVGTLAGTHLSHATGFGWAARIAADPIVVAALFDARAVASGDFHTALNFAGVFHVPVVFVCKHEGRDTKQPPVADKGVAYGVSAVRAAGDDVLAVYSVVREAADKAHKGGGPTLVELVGGGAENDPVARFVRYLEKKGAVTERAIADLTTRVGQELDRAVEKATHGGPPSRESLFDHVTAEAPWHLEEQRRALSRAPRSSGR